MLKWWKKKRKGRRELRGGCELTIRKWLKSLESHLNIWASDSECQNLSPFCFQIPFIYLKLSTQPWDSIPIPDSSKPKKYIRDINQWKRSSSDSMRLCAGNMVFFFFNKIIVLGDFFILKKTAIFFQTYSCWRKN